MPQLPEPPAWAKPPKPHHDPQVVAVTQCISPSLYLAWLADGTYLGSANTALACRQRVERFVSDVTWSSPKQRDQTARRKRRRKPR